MAVSKYKREDGQNTRYHRAAFDALEGEPSEQKNCADPCTQPMLQHAIQLTAKFLFKYVGVFVFLLALIALTMTCAIYALTYFARKGIKDTARQLSKQPLHSAAELHSSEGED
jgi:hypothetical protein